ncbi:MAG: nucleotidyltransferase domain-containing protein, partial [Nanoarchaeota archaeon]|nr:nucleotidyltransferase domain-containing protein [Nanoarchaeota archaeon]
MDLINFLKTKKNARKIFGKREIKIIEKQVLGINLTQSEKNRLSRDIRKKFEFIKSLNKFSGEFRLKKGTKIKEIVEETKEAILEDELYQKIKKIMLFGSATENQLTFRSDVDIAVEFSDTNLKEATLFRKRIYGKTNERADIQVYNVLPKKIKKEIDTKGRILYE